MNGLYFCSMLDGCLYFSISAYAALACVASVSVEQRAKNGVFGVLPARKMGREQKLEGGGGLLIPPFIAL